MNLRRNITIATATVGFSAVAAVAGSASVFFGEDLQTGFIDDQRVPSLANSNAAQSAFLGSLVDPVVEDFESFDNGDEGAALDNFDFGPSGTASIDDGRITDLSEKFPGPDGIPGTADDDPTNGDGRYPISGTNYLLLAPGGGNDITISFSQPVNAFGFFGVDVGDFGGQLTTIVATAMDGTETPYVIDHTIGQNGSTSGSVFFWGLVDPDNEIMSIRLNNDSANVDAFAFDDFTISAFPSEIIPSPAAAGLGLAGLLGLGAMRRRNA